MEKWRSGEVEKIVYFTCSKPKTRLMKLIFCALAVLIFQSVNAQDSTTKYFIKEVGMYMTVPNSYQPISVEENNRIKAKGADLIEKANDIEVDASTTKDVLSIRKGKFNYLNMTVTPFRLVEKNGYEKTNQEVKNIIFKSLEEGMPGLTLDSTSSKIRIDGIPFEKFLVKVSKGEQLIMKMVLISKFYKGYDVGIAYVAVTPESYIELEKMVMTSTFDHLKSTAKPGDPAPKK